MSDYEHDPIDLDEVTDIETYKQSINTPANVESQPPAAETDDEESSSPDKDINEDYENTRDTYYELVVKGQDALDNLLQVASESESARAYEVVATMIKTLSETNEKIMDLHKKAREIKKQDQELNEGGANGKTVNNNAIFVGNMKDFQMMVKDMRSGKSLEEVEKTMKEDEKESEE